MISHKQQVYFTEKDDDLDDFYYILQMSVIKMRMTGLTYKDDGLLMRMVMTDFDQFWLL